MDDLLHLMDVQTLAKSNQDGDAPTKTKHPMEHIAILFPSVETELYKLMKTKNATMENQILLMDALMFALSNQDGHAQINLDRLLFAHNNLE